METGVTVEREQVPVTADFDRSIKEQADKANAKRILHFEQRRLRYLSAEKFNATYAVGETGARERKGPQASLRRARKDARKLRTSHPGKLIATGGLRG